MKIQKTKTERNASRDRLFLGSGAFLAVFSKSHTIRLLMRDEQCEL